MKKYIIQISMMLMVCISISAQNSRTKINLAGEWKFAIDSEDKGIQEKWFSKSLIETITLPGSMTSNGKGNDVTDKTQFVGALNDSSYYKKPEYAKYRVAGNIKIPFWLQPLKYYQGAAWYQKEVTIPKDWNKQDIRLFLERCHWETHLWVDNIEIGLLNYMGVPHVYDLSKWLTPGKHILSICIDNRMKSINLGENSHSISDNTQTNWNGMIGELYLEARPLINIQNIQVYPNLKENKINLTIKVLNGSSISKKEKINIAITGNGVSEKQLKEMTLVIGENILTMEYPMNKDVKYWDEFNPFVYTLMATIGTDSYHTNFGMREIKAINSDANEGVKRFEINGKPLFLRGTLECAIFPKTGYPPTDLQSWLRIYKICRAHGLNHIRFHSWCPPQAAFDAADQMGFYLQVECSSWANSSATVGDGKPLDKWLYDESQRMMEMYGNHPSFCLFNYGNEPAGKNHEKFLSEFVTYWKKKDTRRIYTTASGWPIMDCNDYQCTPGPRIQNWGAGLNSIINNTAPASNYDWTKTVAAEAKQPWVSHEIGEWCVYPNYKEIPKYDGVLRAKNFEIFQESLKDHGMESLADSFLLASGKLQALCYKADIEAALRTKGFGGFQLLDLHDFPGQGTALVGVLDAFWDEKGYITPKEYSRFCNHTVPLARLKKFIFFNNDTLKANVEVAHYGDSPITACVPEWKLIDKTGKIIFSGKLNKTNIELGNQISLGSISLPLATITTSQQLTLEVSVNTFTNSWNIWVYPFKNKSIEGENKIRIVSEINKTTQQFLENGGSVLLTIKKDSLKPEFGGSIAIGFSSIFWNTSWTYNQPPHTLGILCNPLHPALAEFPTEYFSNYQWQYAMSHSNAIILSSLPKEIKPIVRVIDDWFTNRPLALLFEVKVGKGKLLFSGIDFTKDFNVRPEAQQLLYSLKKYMSSERFNPTVNVSSDVINNMIK